MKVEIPKYDDLSHTDVNLFRLIGTHWSLKRLKFVMPQVTVGIVVTPSKYYVEKGVPAIRSLNVKRGRITDEDLVFFSERDNRKLAKTRIYEGDIVIVRTGETGSSAVVDRRFDGANCIDLIIVRKSQSMRSKFLHYFLGSAEASAEISMSSNGAIQQHFNIGLVRELHIVQPGLEEQDSIIEFLDRETSKVDKLVNARVRQIELLQEQRIAVIHHSVTKGIKVEVTMKDSGVEWLGMIPHHWNVHRLRRTTSKPVNGIWGDDETGGEQDIVCVRVADFDRQRREVRDKEKTYRRISRSKRSNRLLSRGDLLLEKSGGGEQQPVGCVVQFTSDHAAVSSNFIAKLSPLPDFNGRFLCFLHQALYETGVTKTSIKQTTGLQNLDSFWYLDEQAAFPPIEEQLAIVSHIEAEVEKIDSLIAKYGRELELLEEYRSSLISHAVTGKIDVHSIAKKRPRQETLSEIL